MLSNEVVAAVIVTLLFFGVIAWMEIYSRRRKRAEESQNAPSPQAENLTLVNPPSAGKGREARSERKTVEKPKFTPESFKSAVEEMRRSNQAIGARNKTTF